MALQTIRTTLSTVRTITTVIGTAIVLHRVVDGIDLTEPKPVDLATVLAVAFLSRKVVSA